MPELTGKGVIIGIIDSGIDYSHPDFRNPDGSTRIIAILDETKDDTIYRREEINLALSKPTRAQQMAVVPSFDPGGHGTHVAGIAAGNGRASDGRIRGVAPEAELLVVKVNHPIPDNTPNSSGILRGVQYCIQTAMERKQPIAVNLSYGTNYGAHNGASELEQTITELALLGETVVCVGTGNEGTTGRHYEDRIVTGERARVEFQIGLGEDLISIQLWKSFVDDFQVTLIAPNGDRVLTSQPDLSEQERRFEDYRVLFYNVAPTPKQVEQLYFYIIQATNEYIPSGIWQLEVRCERAVLGTFHVWLPVASGTNPNTAFLLPDSEGTLTIPSTARNIISVGAYDENTDRFAAFSGQGPTADGRIKPDLVASGVDVLSCAPGGGYSVRTGTSMATPHVTGTAALMMQYGIVDGNDTNLYGEKVKAFLIRCAKPLPGFIQYPNPQVGWGALCEWNL